MFNELGLSFACGADKVGMGAFFFGDSDVTGRRRAKYAERVFGFKLLP